MNFSYLYRMCPLRPLRPTIMQNFKVKKVTFLLLAIIESHCRQWWPSFLLFFYAIFKIFNVFTQKCPIMLMSRPQVLIWCRCIFFHSGVHLPTNRVNHVLLLFNLNKNTITTLTLLLYYLSLKSTSVLFSHRTKKMYVFITNKTSD